MRHMDTKGLIGGKVHYAWVVMAAFGLTVSGTLGTLTVLAGSFFYPVCEDIGCDLSTLTLYMTIMTIVLALALPVVGELLTKVKLQFILTAAAIIEISSLVCMSFFYGAMDVVRRRGDIRSWFGCHIDGDYYSDDGQLVL